MTESDLIEETEIRLLLEAIHACYGHDFRSYSATTLRRQLWKTAKEEGVGTISGLQEKVLHDQGVMERLLWNLSVGTTSVFRDPPFYQAVRYRILPILRTFPFVRIWHAGCSTGEEVYSTAIMLQEEGMLARAKIYATDFHAGVLESARSGRFLSERINHYTRNYHEAGGRGNFSDYYSILNGHAVFHPWLKRGVFFAEHNLATDTSFMEFNMIFCRNVLIYFNRQLQDRAHKIIHQSLCNFGILSLGKKESLQFSVREDCYKTIDSKEKLYQKVR